MRNARADGRGLQSVDRAVTVLEVLATRGEAGVSEVGAALGVHKSTAFRLRRRIGGPGPRRAEKAVVSIDPNVADLASV